MSQRLLVDSDLLLSLSRVEARRRGAPPINFGGAGETSAAQFAAKWSRPELWRQIVRALHAAGRWSSEYSPQWTEIASRRLVFLRTPRGQSRTTGKRRRRMLMEVTCWPEVDWAATARRRVGAADDNDSALATCPTSDNGSGGH